MQHGRGGRLQDAQSTQRDEGRVEGEHETVVCMHALLQRVGDGLEGHQLLQTVGFDGHVCDLAGDGSAGVDGNANVGSGQGGGVVDAVADHHNGVALGLGLLDEVCLVLGQHLGKEAVHAHLLCNGGSGALAVAGHHNNILDTKLLNASMVSFASSRRGSSIRITAASFPPIAIYR